MKRIFLILLFIPFTLWGKMGARYRENPVAWIGVAWKIVPLTATTSTRVNAIRDLGNGILVAGLESTSGDIVRSTDYGETWSKIQQLGTMTGILFIENSAVEGLWAGGGGGATPQYYKSTDQGLTWTLKAAIGQTLGWSMAFGASGVMIGGTGNSAKRNRSTNSGTSWTASSAISGCQISTGFIYLGSNIWLHGCTLTSGRIYRSTDNGVNWSSVYGSGSNYFRVFLDLGSGTVLCGNFGASSMVKSTDYGATWNTVGTKPGVRGVFSLIKAKDNRLFCSTDYDGQVYVSNDNGNTWRFLTTPYFYGTGNNAVWCLANPKADCLVGGTGYGGRKIIKSEPFIIKRRRITH